MRRYRFVLLFILMVLLGTIALHGQSKTYYGAHITSQAPWINRVVVYNNGDSEAGFQVTVWDGGGQVALQEDYTAPANGSRVLVMSNFAGYVPGPDEVALTPVEGTLTIGTDSPKIRPKLSFRYGDEESLTEFFMPDTRAWEYILPNSVEAHFSWTGIALMNPYDTPLTVTLTAYRDGTLQDQHEEAVPANGKYVRLSDGIWPGLLYPDVDQVRISTMDRAFPPPMSITGNDAQDRHVFFNAAVTAATKPLAAGELYATDSIVGDLYYVPAGTFVQGSPADEPCRDEDIWEGQFTHTLTRNLAVMETEVTRQMWADLQAVQPTLVNDPNDPAYGDGMTNPVQNLNWYEALLFANLLSVQQGLTPCYFADEAMTVPIDATNYDDESGDINVEYYCDFTADGYRLPTEGEWEYFCRAGTTGPFFVDVPNYDAGTCDINGCFQDLMPELEAVAWYCDNLYDDLGSYMTKPVGLMEANPWNLKDTHGNVAELCWDWLDFYPAGPVTDYAGPTTIWGRRIVRGGAFKYASYKLRCAARDNNNRPASRAWDTGFRLIRTVE
ncbi:MAG: SUMF1/EgtB/PvdO family nonheme iron enzyme [Acidobacteria bacterium]|nr:SUMF1/EgtB/PvdO family nonheme iron enzyme [Acidobacteriota bacterium]